VKLKAEKELFENFRGKWCRLVVKDDDGGIHVWYGRIVDCSNTHLLEVDRFGRKHIIRLNSILKVTETRK